MKEVDDLKRSLSKSFTALIQLIEKVNAKLEKLLEVKKQPASGPAKPSERKVASKKQVPTSAVKTQTKAKASPKKPAEKKPSKIGSGITEKVQKTIEKNPGIDFKSLLKKTGFEAKQVQNALPPLKKSGKIRSEGRGIYYPAKPAEKEVPANVEQSQKIEETVE
jgi:hypothetical protein